MDKFVHIDEHDRQWYFGKCKRGTISQIGRANLTHHAILPFIVSAAYPEEILDPDTDCIYSHCCMCGKPLERGNLIIEFTESQWGIRIACTSRGISINLPIFEAYGKLEDTIRSAWMEKLHGCKICRKRICREEECKAMIEQNTLQMSPLDEMFEKFYCNRVNVCSMFLESCQFCQSLQNLKACTVCRSVSYCSFKCKKNDDHVCEPYYEIWRSVQFPQGGNCGKE